MLQKTTAPHIGNLHIYYFIIHLVSSVPALGCGWWETLVFLWGENICCLQYFDFSEESVALGKYAAGG